MRICSSEAAEVATIAGRQACDEKLIFRLELQPASITARTISAERQRASRIMLDQFDTTQGEMSRGDASDLRFGGVTCKRDE